MNMIEAETVGDLVQKMIISLCGEQKPELIRKWIRFSLGLLSSSQGVETIREDEITVISHIKDKLSSGDAVQFDKLYIDLKAGPLRNRVRNLTFLLNMCQSRDQMRERIFSAPDLNLRLCSSVPSTSDIGNVCTVTNCICR